MQPCIQETRIRNIENAQRDNSHEISDLTKTVEKVVEKVDVLIKVLLIIAAKVGIGLILVLGYLIKTLILGKVI